MGDIGLSEFSFGFAFLHEQTLRRWKKIVGVPILPSLRRESKLGWDVKLPLRGKAFYYQFKLSERFDRRNSKFIADGTYNGPYYRIALHKADSNQQHRNLWELAQILGNEDTYYVAPEVPTSGKFREAFLTQSVTENSRLIPLRNCANYLSDDREQHYITFKEGDKTFIQHSKQIKNGVSIPGKGLFELQESKQQTFTIIDNDYTMNLAKKVEDSVHKIAKGKKENIIEKLTESKNDEKSSITNELNYIANLLLTAFDLMMVIVGELE